MPGAAPASLAQGSSPPASGAPVIHGWPGARFKPAGLYSWTVGPERWMHNVSWEDSDWAEVTFASLPDDAYSIPVDGLEQPGFDLDRPYSEVPEHVVDTRMQAWIMDVDGTRVVVIVKTYPGTAAGLIAEAEEVVRSIHVEPAGTGLGRRVVFTLSAGWDSG